MCNQIHQEWYGWVRAAKRHSTENGANTTGIKQGELVQRTPFPTFTGLKEGWVKFKRVFQEMISTSGRSKALELAQLTVQLPPEAKLWIKELWERLDQPYENKELALLSTMYRLESLELPQGSAHWP